MVEYAKPWLSVEEQIDRLAGRGVAVEGRDRARSLLNAVGYYRLTGYLYPFRESERVIEDGRSVIRVLDTYRPGTTLHHAEEIIDFDRRLRALVMEGVERIEVAVRMQVGHVLGRQSPFAYEDPACFTQAFTAEAADIKDPAPSKHIQWLQRVSARKAGSDEQFVEHFRRKYDDRMPIWALTEVLELGHLAVLYRGTRQKEAEEIASAFAVPTKKTMANWLASLNYVRNVAAHHSRLFNRKLQYAPSRPKVGTIPLLDHLRDVETPKEVFGAYNILAVIAYLLISVDVRTDWTQRLADLLRAFPTSHVLTVASMGAPQDWESLDLWDKGR